MNPDLDTFDAIVVNSSAGKDSQTALRRVVLSCDEVSMPRDRIVVSHQDLGRMEWPGTKELAEQQAQHYGLIFIVTTRRRADGTTETLLDYVRRRRKWPDNKNRFCTSDFKRAPGSRVITAVANRMRNLGLTRPRILNVFGFRAAESPARAKKPSFTENKRLSNSKREVWDWLPIHEWSEDQVWSDIRESGVPYHPAYDLGMPRLSCSFCIFAPKPALMIAGKARPELLQEYVDLENEIDHRFTDKTSLQSIQDAIREGEEVGEMDGSWNM